MEKEKRAAEVNENNAPTVELKRKDTLKIQKDNLENYLAKKEKRRALLMTPSGPSNRPRAGTASEIKMPKEIQSTGSII